MKEVGNWHKPLESIEADVICLQETKITSKFKQSFITILYNSAGETLSIKSSETII